MPELDRKATSVFAGKVVRKDLVRKVKVGANVPVFVLEYLLGKYCATEDPAAIAAGLRVVNTTLATNFVRPDEANKAQSVVKDKGKHTFIDKVKVRYLADDDKHWAELVNFGNRYVHVPEPYLRQYDRLLMGGIWAQVDIRHQYDEEAKGKRSPFWIEHLRPIQIATFDLEEYRACQQQFTSEEWIDLLCRSIGLEPSYFDRRLKLLFLARLLPLCEHNYNLVELGPRGTGKSYVYQELSPYTILLTGPTTVANLFYNMATGKMGLVGIWDAIAFDEVADLQKMPKEVVTTLKTYCESGTFARGKEALSGLASLAMFGNTNQPVEVMVRSSHLFAPMPEVIREDMAFIDRLHYYLPGWEVPEQGGRDMISTDPLAPGSVYAASVDDQGKVGLYRLEVGCSPGTGKLKTTGGIEGTMKESIQRAFAYIQGHKTNMGIAQAVDTTDFHIEAIDLLANHIACDAGIGLIVAIYSALKKYAALSGLLILGDLSIQGNIKAVCSLAEPLQIGMDNGARRALIPIENKRHFLDVSADIMERVDPIFYSDPMTAAMKALGMN